MGKSYSVDLREKVVSYIASFGCKKEASKIFNIGIDTVYRWLRLSQAGDVGPKKRTSFYQLVDPEKLKQHIEKHPDHTLVEIAAALNLSRQTVFRWLRRLKITPKKRPSSTKNATKKIGTNSKNI